MTDHEFFSFNQRNLRLLRYPYIQYRFTFLGASQIHLSYTSKLDNSDLKTKKFLKSHLNQKLIKIQQDHKVPNQCRHLALTKEVHSCLIDWQIKDTNLLGIIDFQYQINCVMEIFEQNTM